MKNVVCFLLMFMANTILFPSLFAQNKETEAMRKNKVDSLFKQFYSFEMKDVVITDKGNYKVIDMHYSDTQKNIKGNKVLTINFNAKLYQYESYFREIVIDHKHYSGMKDNFGLGKWYPINLKPSEPLDILIFNVYKVFQK